LSTAKPTPIVDWYEAVAGAPLRPVWQPHEILPLIRRPAAPVEADSVASRGPEPVAGSVEKSSGKTVRIL